MTISDFSTGQRHVSGNRCDRGASLERRPPKSPIPNMVDWKYKRTFGYRRLTEAKAHRGDIGIPRVLGMYENYPFWFTVLTALGFRVMLSGRSSHDLFEQGMESIPSENVCYPAKLAHGHVESLLDKGVTTIFYPCVSYEKETSPGQDNTFNCPIVATYPEVLRRLGEARKRGCHLHLAVPLSRGQEAPANTVGAGFCRVRSYRISRLGRRVTPGGRKMPRTGRTSSTKARKRWTISPRAASAASSSRAGPPSRPGDQPRNT